MVIAVDGPAGAGKSTVCRLLAERLGYIYLDTGAMYRAVAWGLARENCRPEEESRMDENLPRLPLCFRLEEGALIITYQGKRLTDELRSPEIAQRASRISQIASVRGFLTEWQRRLAQEADIVAEGRDMATVVFPDAPVKVFLTADLATRAGRRFAEYRLKGIPVEYSDLEAQIRDRDKADQERSLAPLRPAPDALVLDTSHLEVSEVVARIFEYVGRKRIGVEERA